MKMNKLIEKLDEEDKKKIKEKGFPSWINPMLAKLTHNHFSDKNWIYERKLDGERCLIFKERNKIRIMSRNKKDLNHVYPEVVNAFNKQKSKNFVVDGEMVTFKGNVSSFSKLQNRMHLATEKEAEENNITVFHYMFDIMYFDKYDITGLSLRKRKSILKSLLNFKDPLRYLIHRNEAGKEYYKEACSKNWEGIIAKNAASEYKSGRGNNWLKFKCTKQQEFVIIGYTDPQGERIGFGALLIGYYERDKLNYAGKVGTGYNDDMLKHLRKKLSSIERKTSPLNENIKEKRVHWVRPKLICEVGFSEWTSDGKLRHPRFLGLRRDKNPGKVVREDKG
jgi:bifunctional non-homologous end joining protein LigD